MGKTKCILCGVGPREVPDRERMGRPIKRVCRSCHAARLRSDLDYILQVRQQRRKALRGEGE